MNFAGHRALVENPAAMWQVLCTHHDWPVKKPWSICKSDERKFEMWCKFLGAQLKILGAQLIMLGASISKEKVKSLTVPHLFVIFSL